MNLHSVFEVLVCALVLAGATLALIGAFGLVRFSSFYQRLHAPSKTGTLGVGCVLLASALWFGAGGQGGQSSGHELLIVLFLFIGMPVAALRLTQAALKLDAAALREPPD